MSAPYALVQAGGPVVDDVDFVGGDPESEHEECPAIWRAPGGAYIRGKTVADPDLTARFGQDVGKSDDETDVWVPDRLFPAIRAAIDDTFEKRRQGPGRHDFKTLLGATEHSLIRFETRDAYDRSEWQREDLRVAPCEAARGM